MWVLLNWCVFMEKWNIFNISKADPNKSCHLAHKDTQKEVITESSPSSLPKSAPSPTSSTSVPKSVSPKADVKGMADTVPEATFTAHSVAIDVSGAADLPVEVHRVEEYDTEVVMKCLGQAVI